MHCPLRCVRWALVAVLMLIPFGCGKSVSNIKPVGDKAEVVQEMDPGFIVPDGSPESILVFIQELRSNRPKFRSKEEMETYMRKAERTLNTAADKILAQKASDEALNEATVMKLSTNINSALNPQLSPEEAAAASKKAVELVKRYQQDERKAVADTADSFQIVARIPAILSMSSTERGQFADEAVRIVMAKPSQIAIGTVDFLAERLSSVKETELAISLCNQMSKALEESASVEFKGYAKSFQSRANQISFNTPGSKIEIEGELLTGGNLDWNSYRGKVVLVDFWATWCGPCVAELPNVVKSYKEYHDKGFEVVGVSLDRERRQLEAFLEAKPLPWVQIYSDSTRDSRGAGNDLADKFGVSSIPRAYLVDREGKLVSTDVRGPELDRLLKTMFE